MEKQTTISIQANMDDFEGVTAHMFQIVSSGTEARLDCIYVDQMALAAGADEVSGKVVSRINMSTQRLQELHDLLGDHLDGIGEE